MARIRTIKPEFFRHEELQALGPIPMLLFVGLWTQADKAGNFPWRPAQLKLDILPFLEYDLGSTLEALRKSGFILPYKGDDGKPYGHIPNFSDHQRFFGSEIKNPPRFPAFSEENKQEEAPRKHQGSALEDPRTVESGIRNQESGQMENVPASPGGAPRAKAKPKPEFPHDSTAYEAARFFWEYVRDWSPQAIEPTEAGYQAWARDCDLMFRKDGRTPDAFNELMDWIDTRKESRDGFSWRKNVLCPATLRKRWNEGKFADFLPSELAAPELR